MKQFKCASLALYKWLESQPQSPCPHCMSRNQVLGTFSSTPIALFAEFDHALPEGFQLEHSISVLGKCFLLSAVCYQPPNHFYGDALRLDRNQHLDFRRMDDQANVDPSAIGPGDLTDTPSTQSLRVRESLGEKPVLLVYLQSPEGGLLRASTSSVSSTTSASAPNDSDSSQTLQVTKRPCILPLTSYPVPPSYPLPACAAQQVPLSAAFPWPPSLRSPALHVRPEVPSQPCPYLPPVLVPTLPPKKAEIRWLGIFAVIAVIVLRSTQ